MEGEDEREREVKAGRVRKEWEQGEKEKRGEENKGKDLLTETSNELSLCLSIVIHLSSMSLLL